MATPDRTARRVIDWTRSNFAGEICSHIATIRSKDWSTSPLGQMTDWPITLRQALVSNLANREPRLVLWGSSEIVVYNEAFVPLVGDTGLENLGKPCKEAFPALWAQLEPFVNLALTEGEPTFVSQMPITSYRRGYAEDTFWYLNLLPLLGDDGFAVGVLGEFSESTTVVLGERRTATTTRVRAETSSATHLGTVWETLLRALTDNVEDCPYALLYSVGEESWIRSKRRRPDIQTTQSFLGRAASSDHCQLEGVVRVSENNAAAIKSFPYNDDGSHPYTAPFREAAKTREIVHLADSDHRFRLPDCLRALVPKNCSSGITQQVVVIALPPISGPGVYGFLLIGLNPRCPLDDDYKLFFRLLGDVLVNAITAMTLPQEHRLAIVAAEEAALKHASLLRQLAVRTQEVERSEAKFTKMAQQSPIGLFFLDPTTERPLYLNPACKKLLRVDQNSYNEITGNISKWDWRELVHEEDVAICQAALADVIESQKIRTIEPRLKVTWTSTDSVTGAEMNGTTWIRVTMIPETDPDGTVERIMGWMADISLSKWTEGMHNKRLEEALENQRQKEQYIDITSHEIRNPLSAMLQSADYIVTTLNERLSTNPNGNGHDALDRESMESMLDAGQTIILCANHQKAIVDDVLTLSKLDANLLGLAPGPVKPFGTVQETLKMFEAELQNLDIQMNIHSDSTWDQLADSRLQLDAGRLRQILINLISNAIKFVKGASERVIELRLSASYNEPPMDYHVQSFTPRRQHYPQIHCPDGGSDTQLFLSFLLKDTGPGISENQINRLFQRFSQASAKTYEQYGGSGLGLAISRELVELHGGRIAVTSRVGEGTMFAFYIKTIQCGDAAVRSLSQLSSQHEAEVNGGSGPIAKPEDATRTGERVSKSTAISDHNTNEPKAVESTSFNSDKPLHILLVEDNVINQKVMAQQLKKKGATVYTSDNGQEALDFLKRTTFVKPRDGLQAEELYISVVLMDIEMPVMDGLTCIQNIRRMQENGEIVSHIPVIAVTANAREEQVSEVLAHGMDSVVTKPFRVPELMPKIDEVLARLKRSLPNPHD